MQYYTQARMASLVSFISKICVYSLNFLTPQQFPLIFFSYMLKITTEIA